MKKILLAIGLFGMTGLAIHAEDIVTVQNCALRATGTESAIVELSTEVENYRGFQADVVLPVGITVTGITDAGRGVETENVDVNKRFGKAESTEVEDVVMQKQTVVFAISCNFKTGDGALLNLTLAADETVAAGTYTGYLKNVLLSYSTGTTVPVSESSFTIEVYEGNVRVVLDENSTTAPEASEEVVDVTLKRTIKANQWSTICLPFAMTAEQVKTAFGDDVQLADFVGCNTEEDGDDNTIGVTVNFETATAIEANHPYIIKVTEPVTEFTVDGVVIDPEDEPSVQSVALRTGSGTKKDPYVYFYDYFTGTYVANTTLPAVSLFLNNNQFWYSTGATTMKGYRAYFELYFNLTDVENAYAEVKMAIDVDGTATRVEGMTMNDAESTIYDLSGRRVSKPQKSGVYIVNGKKALIK